jgi:hypothetical protein
MPIYKYNSNDKFYKQKQRAYNKHKLYEIIMSNFCQHCGLEDPDHPEIYDFDHQHDKIECVSNMLSQSRNWDKVWEEIKKCQILCANCHRKKTQIDKLNNVKLPETPSLQVEIF